MPEVNGVPDRQPFLLAFIQPGQDIDVSLGVLSMASAGPLGLGQAVTPFPSPDRSRIHASLLDHGLNIEVGSLLIA
jgi:hypothetical protein